MRRKLVAAGMAALTLGIGVPAISAGAAPANGRGTGTVRIVVTTPDGVPANAGLRGRTEAYAAKPPTGTSSTTAFTLPVGVYQVDLPRVTFEGRAYTGTASRPDVLVRPNETATLAVTYAPEPGGYDLHVTGVTKTSVALAWSGPRGARYALRRTLGPNPVTLGPRPSEIRTSGRTAVDSGLSPGTVYSYWLYTLVDGQWNGPLPIAVGTTPEAGSTDASFVAAATTLLATPADLVSTETTGDGVRVVLARPIATLLLGSAVVLPVSATLPGGFLGVVSSITADRRTITLTAGGLGDAFDYYDISVDDLSVGGPEASSQERQEPAPAPGSREPEVSTTAIPVSCTASGQLPTVNFAPAIALGGSFTSTVDKHGFLGMPSGASLDLKLTAKVTGAASISTGGNAACKLALPKLFRTLTFWPVPISVSLTPKAELSVKGAVRVTSLGVTATGGVRVAGTMSTTSGASFSGSPLLEVAPITPSVTANGSIDLRIGGDVELGPGAGTSGAGVIAGLDGTFYPVDAGFDAAFSAADPRFNVCTVARAAFSRSLRLTARAWFSKWKFEQTIPLAALGGSTPYPGSPWHLPTGCDKAPGPAPQDSLLGGGLTKVGDSTTGSAGQWGHLPGFAPGKKTWVLSTGRIADATGTPSQLASTRLDQPGDAELAALAGHPTFDAATYTVTVVPAGNTLNVRYVFASEEYPEFVGSPFNDVMAVRVNGKNCATVPGGTAPVSVNTINAQTNSAHYVNNAAGAAGYSTSMNGLTVPLTCSVPVVPGKAVTVQVAVADTSDYILDSAVALVDGGIWSA